LVEGDFVWQDIPVNSKRSLLQKQEIISCLREENNVKLKCTGMFFLKYLMGNRFCEYFAYLSYVSANLI